MELCLYKPDSMILHDRNVQFQPTTPTSVKKFSTETLIEISGDIINHLLQMWYCVYKIVMTSIVAVMLMSGRTSLTTRHPHA